MSRWWLLGLLLVACGRHETPVNEVRREPPPPVAQPDPKTKTVEASVPAPPAEPPVQRDLDAIVAAKELKVLFTFNSTGYFVYRGETMGYEYEALRLFAHDLGVKLVPIVVRDSRTLFDLLNKGEGDLVAAQLVPGASETRVVFSDGLYETTPVVVQRKAGPATSTAPDVARALERERRSTPDPQGVVVRARLIATPQELAGERVYLPKVSPYRERLLELNEELTNDIDVVEVDESSDKLIQQLSEGDIAYTVAAENVAALKAGEYSNLIIKPQIGPPQPVAWALRLNAPALRTRLNAWIAAKKKSSYMAVLYKKYFKDRRGFVKRTGSQYFATETGHLSPWDDTFRISARIPGWDWRLVASQAFQESRFNPNARSWAGAIGIMQIMPRTARELHINAADPRQSIEGACRYLWKIDQRWPDVKREEERIKFILAAYNVGTGHIDDARRLATKHGDDPTAWKDVSYWLIRKSKRDVYNDPVVQHGFARGTEPVAYVDEILGRFAHYQAVVPKEPVEAPAAEPAVPVAPSTPPVR